jgi:hypothetical protein
MKSKPNNSNDNSWAGEGVNDVNNDGFGDYGDKEVEWGLSSRL